MKGHELTEFKEMMLGQRFSIDIGSALWVKIPALSIGISQINAVSFAGEIRRFDLKALIYPALEEEGKW